jgi:heptose I phosphotransferase
MGTLHIHPDYRAALEAAGLATFDALFEAGRAGHVDGHMERSVSRLELPGAAGPRIIYLKRQWGHAARLSRQDFFRHGHLALPAHREWRNTMRLFRAGIPVAPPVAWGRSRGPEGLRTLIAFGEVRGPSLARWLFEASRTPAARPPAAGRRAESGVPTALAGVPLAACPPVPPRPHTGGQAASGTRVSSDTPSTAPRRAVAVAVGRAVRRLHDAGFSFPDLYGKHLFLQNLDGKEPRVVLIDPQRLRRRAPWRRARDLAALSVSTRPQGASRTDRLRVLLAYLGTDRLTPAARQFIGRVERVAARIPGRGQDPHLMPSRRDGRGQETLQPVDGGRLRVATSLLPALQAAGLATLDALMAFSGGKPYRDKEGRSTVRLELPDPAGGTRVLFLKRYRKVPWRTQVRRTLAWKPPSSFAEAEARAILRTDDAGVPTLRRLAVGETLTRRGREERSCLLTEEIAGAVEADTYCEKAFGGAPSPAAMAAKRRFIGLLAERARRFHDARLTHRDFYLCHFLVRPATDGDPAMHLIDLQRVIAHRGALPRRWRVKDLGSLLFSSRPGPGTRIRSAVFTRTDALRFAHAYFGVGRLTPEQKDLLREVLAKAGGIARREKRLQRRRDRA